MTATTPRTAPAEASSKPFGFVWVVNQKDGTGEFSRDMPPDWEGLADVHAAYGAPAEAAGALSDALGARVDGDSVVVKAKGGNDGARLLCSTLVAMIEAATTRPTLARGLTDAASDVLAERQRQVSGEGWTPEHDDQHGDGALARAAAVYANPDIWNVLGHLAWPFDGGPKLKSERQNLVRAGALVLAEIDRLDRLHSEGRTP